MKELTVNDETVVFTCVAVKLCEVNEAFIPHRARLGDIGVEGMT